MFASIAIALLLGAADAPALPQPPTLTVQGEGRVETAPDLALLSISIRGEGKTPDDAAASLARKHKAITDGIGALSPGGVGIETGDIASRVTRSPECRTDDEDNVVASTGPCAITGYVVSMSLTVRMTSINDAGTAVGLALRLGAVKAEVDSFTLKSPADAIQRANVAAFENARAQAASIAAASGQRLGPVVTIRNDQPSVIIVSDSLSALPALRSTYAGRPPVKIDVTPGPVRTISRLYVVFTLIL